MGIKATFLMLLGLGATIAAAVGCGAAPASQISDTSSAREIPKVESSAEQPSMPAPEAKAAPAAEESASPISASTGFQIDSIPPKAVAAAKDEQDSATVEIGYKIGMHAPEFGMSLLDGTTVTSASLVDEGKPVFIYFHATW